MPQTPTPTDDVHTDSNGDLHQNGVPVHATDEEATGLPTSDRHMTETAAHEAGGDANAPKHDHGAKP
jgi:hypothetical protein